MPAYGSGRHARVGQRIDLSGQHLAGCALSGDRARRPLLNQLRLLLGADPIIALLADALVEQRFCHVSGGQQGDDRLGPEQKAQLIQQWTARTVTGQSTSSEVLAREVNALTDSCLSARTVRWHLQHLGLSAIRDTLPELVETLKKTPADRQ